MIPTIITLLIVVVCLNVDVHDLTYDYGLKPLANLWAAFMIIIRYYLLTCSFHCETLATIIYYI
jgi:hypothetical protein